MIELVVGLGNPGKQYRDTRHNVGFMALEHLPYSLNWQSKFKGEYSSAQIGDRKIYFLMPQTFMNLSGESVGALAHFFKIEKPENVLVVHDELDLPFGTVALKKGGGLAGHNGLKSISVHLSSNDFCRLRVGISRPTIGAVSDYVLSPFAYDEKILIEKLLALTSLALGECIENGYEKAATKYSKKTIMN